MAARVEIIRDQDALERLRPEWTSLLRRSGTRNIFLTPEWMLTWWEMYGGQAQLFLVAVWAEDRLIGLLPLFITSAVPRQLRLVGSTAVCSDRLDGLLEEGSEREVVSCWASAVRQHQSQWDVLEFTDLDREGLLWKAIQQDPSAWGENLSWMEREGDECPFIPLPSSWELYLGNISAKTRREIRHDRRVLEQRAKASVRVVTETAEVDEAMAAFMRLHQARRESLGEQGSFSDERYERFHRAVSREFAERGWLRLWLLEIDGTPVAARYQFVYHGRVYDYLPGHHPQWHKYSVGLVLLSHCLEQAILAGDQEMDLLRGTESYKSRWTHHRRRQGTLTGSRRFTRAWVRQTTAASSYFLRQTVKEIMPDSVVQGLRQARQQRSAIERGQVESRFIPFFPSTAPRDLWGPRWTRPRPFPLDDPRTRFYYFARNGIWHAIDLLGLTSKDEVLMPAYNNGMEVAPFQHRGIPLRYVHVDRQMALDLKDLQEKINPRTRMVYVIHYLGFAQPIEEIRALCQKKGLTLFEDCALAFGSSVNGAPLGSFGDLAIFCLAKFLPVPNGGVLVLNSAKLGDPPPTQAPSGYSVASQVLTKMLDHLETHGGSLAMKTRRIITRTSQRLAGRAKLRRVDSGVMEFMPDKVDWGMSSTSSRILARVDYDAVSRKRRENYLTLLEMVRGVSGVTPLQPSLPDGVCPLFLPVLVDDNQRVCNALIARRVCAGGFWSWFPPGVPVEEFPDSVFLRKHVLELQVHQDLDVRHLEVSAKHLHDVMRSL